MGDADDPERNRFSARLGRAARVGASLSGVAAQRIFGARDEQFARALKEALGRSKGPLMKLAQLAATIPELLPETYAAELRTLQSQAPAMGWPFVARRMRAELGEAWKEKFASFDHEAVAAASLGQVHRARAHDGRILACKLQYPDMASAVEADLGQLRTLLGLVRTLDGALDSSEAVEEIADRLREELDYEREAKHIALFRSVYAEDGRIVTPTPLPELSTRRLLTMTWLEGRGLLSWLDDDESVRNRIATLLFTAWWAPMMRFGVIHGDPHLGNYSLSEGAETLNVIDFGCVRVFPPRFVSGVVALYRALEQGDRDGVAQAYADWGFKNLNNDTIEALTIWARFIYGPMLDDRIRTISDDVAPGAYGRKELLEVRTRLKRLGPITVPAPFVFMDRAALGLGAAFLHLRAKLNFARLFQDSIAAYSEEALAARQAQAVAQAGLS